MWGAGLRTQLCHGLERFLASLPPLQSLRSLHLEVCKLTALPQRWPVAEGLEELSLADNKFVAVPSCLQNAVHLQRLEYSFNKLVASTSSHVCRCWRSSVCVAARTGGQSVM